MNAPPTYVNPIRFLLNCTQGADDIELWGRVWICFTLPASTSDRMLSVIFVRNPKGRSMVRTMDANEWSLVTCSSTVCCDAGEYFWEGSIGVALEELFPAFGFKH